jgi:hypothetical protein
MVRRCAPTFSAATPTTVHVRAGLHLLEEEMRHVGTADGEARVVG